MTCIVGVAQDGIVWLGGDSAGVSGWDMHVREDAKVFKRGPFIMGFTTSFRMGQLLRYSLDVRDQKPDEPADEFMVVAFIEGVRQCLKDGGWNKVENNREEGGNFLVGYEGRLFEVHGDFQVAEYSDGLAACGCGEAYALGALDATPDLEPEERVLNALRIAERRSAGVALPFTVMHI